MNKNNFYIPKCVMYCKYSLLVIGKATLFEESCQVSTVAFYFLAWFHRQGLHRAQTKI